MGGNVNYIHYDDDAISREFRAQMELWVKEGRVVSTDARSWISCCKEADRKWERFVVERDVRQSLALSLRMELGRAFDDIGEEMRNGALELLPDAKRLCLEILRNMEGFDRLQVRLDLIVLHTMGVMHELGGFSKYGKGDEAADFIWELLSQRPQKIKDIFEHLEKTSQFSSRAMMFLAMMRMHGTPETKNQAKEAETAMVDRLCFRPKRESYPLNVIPLRPRPMRL